MHDHLEQPRFGDRLGRRTRLPRHELNIFGLDHPGLMPPGPALGARPTSDLASLS